MHARDVGARLRVRDRRDRQRAVECAPPRSSGRRRPGRRRRRPGRGPRCRVAAQRVAPVALGSFAAGKRSSVGRRELTSRAGLHPEPEGRRSAHRAEARSLGQRSKPAGPAAFRPLGLVPSSSRADTPPEGWEVLEMPTDCTGHAGGGRTRGSPEAGWEHRLATRGARIEHLEGALEGLQHAVDRPNARGEQESRRAAIGTAPERMAGELSRDARRRGL
jgi:hypothetical protein